MTPLISVIIPSYNSAGFIREALDSVFGQTGVPLEVLVVDDGSTDDTQSVLEGYGDRIRVLTQVRGGPYRARNLAASHARGEWLAFLDADDDWLPGKLAAQLRLAQGGADLVYTDRLNFGDLSRVKARQSDSVTLHQGDVFASLLMGNFITLSSVLLRKSTFNELGGFDIARHGVQDWDLWLRYAGTGRTVGLCTDALTRYRIHDQQMTNDLMGRAGDREAVLKKALASPRGTALPSRTASQALASVWRLAGWHASSENRWLAVHCYVRSARYWPWNIETTKGLVKALIGRH